jgi:hypothetical protein
MLTKLLIGTAALITVAAAYAAWTFMGPSHPPETFSASEWAKRRDVYAVSNDPGCVRGGMALDLMDRQLLAGLQAAQVAALLGAPDHQAHRSWRYEIGQCSGFGWHSSQLVVKLGPTESVEHVEFVMIDGHR